jgi:hypothetical protein
MDCVPSSAPRACVWALAAGAALLWPGAAGGQAVGGASAAPAEQRPARAHPAPHASVADIGQRAEEARVRLRDMAASSADDADFAALEAEVSEVSHAAAARWENTTALLAGSPRRVALEGRADDWRVLGGAARG